MNDSFIDSTDPVPTTATESFSDSSTQVKAEQASRIAAFDGLLGIAVLGLFLANIQKFGLTNAQVDQLVRGPHGVSYWLFTLNRVFFSNTMQALAALLAGASILWYLAKPTSTSDLPRTEQFIRRQLWLSVFGVVNAILLLCPTDLLFQFGIVGLILFPLARFSTRGLLIGALLTGLVLIGKGYWNYTEQHTQYSKYATVVALEKKNKNVKLTDEQKDDKGVWEGQVKRGKYDPKKDQETITEMRSDFGTVYDFLINKLRYRQSMQLYQWDFWSLTSMMLLGMVLFRLGFFTNRFTTGQYVGLALGGLVLGQALAWLARPSFEQKLVDYTDYFRLEMWPLSDLLWPIEQAFSAIGLASLVLVLYRIGAESGLGRALSAVGQLALTNYFLQTVFGTMLFYGYGMGYFGSLKLYYLYGIVVESWLVQLVFSRFWLRYFRFGPVEWGWQSLTTGRKLPMRYAESSPALPTLAEA